MPEFTEAIFTKINDLPEISPVDGVIMHPLTGERLMLLFVDLEPNAAVAAHRHHNEQGGTVFSGELLMTIDGATHSLKEGDAFVIPPEVEHSAQAGPEGCRTLDVFTPPREAYLIK